MHAEAKGVCRQCADRRPPFERPAAAHAARYEGELNGGSTLRVLRVVLRKLHRVGRVDSQS